MESVIRGLHRCWGHREEHRGVPLVPSPFSSQIGLLVLLSLLFCIPFPRGCPNASGGGFCRLQTTLPNGFSKAPRKIPRGNPAGQRGIAAFSEQGNSSFGPAAARACTQQLAEELAGFLPFPQDGNSPGPGKASAGGAQHQEAPRARGQEVTAHSF